MTPTMPAASSFTLADGRKLAYQKMGDTEGGHPVLFFHGTPGTHRLGYAAEAEAKQAGICLICPDRPGMGESDFQPDRQLHHWSLDIVQLLHHLHIAACPIIAISGGAPHALQCAYDLPKQITSLTVLSGWLSMGLDEAQGITLPKATAQMQKLLMRWGWLHPVIGPLVNKIVKHKPEALLHHIMPQLAAADRILLAPGTLLRSIFLSDIQNAYQQGWKGPVQEGKLQFAAPHYQMSAITQPVTVLHGTADSIAPHAMGEAIARHVPNLKQFISIPEGGHFCAIEHLKAVFEQLPSP